MSIGERIKSLRKANGKSQEDLAMDIGVSRQTINKWETDKVQPNTENIMMLCSVFEVNSDYFLGLSTKEEKNEAAAQMGEEVAAGVEREIAASINLSQKTGKRKGLMAFSIVIGLLFVISVFICILFGFVVFSPNTGDRVIKTDGIEMTGFVCALVFSIITLVAEIVLLLVILKNNKSKQKLT